MTRAPHEAYKVVRYSVVGVANTATDFAVFSLLLYVAGMRPLWANCLAFLVAVTQSYVVNARWTFQQHTSDLTIKSYLYFVAINLGCLALSSSMIFLLQGIVSPILAKVLAAAIVLAWGFLLSRRFVFGKVNNEVPVHLIQARSASE